MNDLRGRLGGHFWADPSAFFTDGDAVNLGTDFCLMPSAFEPGGIVQQEFFVAGTPVIAFKTGGLRDTVVDWTGTGGAAGPGTGFTFENHTAADLQGAIRRALAVYAAPSDYARLRSNARASVMDLSVVSLAWLREFHRVRRCLPPAPRRPVARVPVRFAVRTGEIPGVTAATCLEVTGSFTGWSSRVPLAVSAVRGGGAGGEAAALFTATLELPPGT
jgi:hypothetical protein